MSKPITPLTAWLRLASKEQRERLAALAGTTVNYLYQCAGCARGSRISADLAFRIEDAMKKLRQESGNALPVVTARDLATMCTLVGLDE